MPRDDFYPLLQTKGIATNPNDTPSVITRLAKQLFPVITRLAKQHFSVITRLALASRSDLFFYDGDRKTRLLRDFVPRNDEKESLRNDGADGSLRGIRQDAEAISEISTLLLATGGFAVLSFNLFFKS
ncbi:hypothetical protein [Thermodesulfovibrio hydrogeniphilus]